MKREIIIAAGLPYAGQKEWAERMIQKGGFAKRKHWYIVDAFQIRSQLAEATRGSKDQIGTYDWSNWVKSNVQSAIENQFDVVLIDTHLSPSHMQDSVNMATMLNCDYRILEFYETKFEKVVENNRKAEYGLTRSQLIELCKAHIDLFPNHKEALSIPEKGKFVPNPKNPPCIIVDIDGTVATRVKGGRDPYDMTKVSEDIPQFDVLELIEAYATKIRSNEEECKVIFVSGRADKDSCWTETSKWLEKHKPGLKDLLFLRDANDNRKDSIVKEDIFWKHIAWRFNPVAVFDDRMSVVKLWVNLGLRVYQVYTPGQDDNDF